MKKTKELALEILVNLFEEILNGKNSDKHLSEESIKLINEIQSEIEMNYSNIYREVQERFLSKKKVEIFEEKNKLHDEENNKYITGINNLNYKDLEKDYLFLENSFSSACIVSVYSIKKSLETLYKILKEHLLKIIERNLMKTISDEKAKKSLEEKIKIISEKKIKTIMGELEKEINSAFPEINI